MNCLKAKQNEKKLSNKRTITQITILHLRYVKKKRLLTREPRLSTTYELKIRI